MKIQIRNLQKIRKIKAADLRKKIKTAVRGLFPSDKTINVILCENCAIRKLNKQFLHRDFITDVIAFSLEDRYSEGEWGEIVVSVEEAVRNCERYSFCWEQELLLYIIHGILHLLGYAHHTTADKRRMRGKERELLALIYPKSD